MIDYDAAPICLHYSNRKIAVVPFCSIYTLIGMGPQEQENVWCLAYLDRHMLGSGLSLSRRQRRLQEALRRKGLLTSPAIVDPKDGRDDGDEAWPLTKGYLAGLFISLAQTRRSQIIEGKRKESIGSKSPINPTTRPAETGTPDLTPGSAQPTPILPPNIEPRYQILLTDRAAPTGPADCVQLYTAQISDFLLEHFRTPAQRPARNAPHQFMRINRSVIPAKPSRSFQRRLRAAIMHDANTTVGGFFRSDLN